MSETDDEVISVSELEFNEQIMRHRKKRRISEEEETCAFSTDSTEEESRAHEHQGLMSIASRTRSRRNKHRGINTKTRSSDTESNDVSSYCSFSESDDSDDLDFEHRSGSCSQSQRMGGKKGEKHVARRESLVERVYEEPREEQNKSMAKGDRLVKLISRGPIGGKNKKNNTGVGKRRAREIESARKCKPLVVRLEEEPRDANIEFAHGRRRGGKGKKPVAIPDYEVVERSYQEPVGVEGDESKGKRKLVVRLDQEPKGSQDEAKKIVKENTSGERRARKKEKSVHTRKVAAATGETGESMAGAREKYDGKSRNVAAAGDNGERMAGESEKSVGIGEFVAEQVHQESKSGHEMHDSSPPCEENKQVHENDPGNKQGEEVMDESVENPAERRKSGSPGEGHGIRRFMLDSLLNKATVFVEEEFSEPAFKLPLKFRFEDEVPKPKEKTDFEIELENLYADLNHAWRLDEARSLHQQQVNEDIAESSDNGTSQDQQVCKGKHHFMEDDALGIVCTVCQHIEVEAKHILPPWAEKPNRRAEKRKFPADNQRPNEECIRFTPGITSCAVYLNPGEGSVWDIKPGVRDSMYEHQREGFEFLWKNLAGSTDLFEIMSSSHKRDVGGCIISHAPGTGKTRLTMMFVETYLKLFPDCRPIIIAPSCMLLTWEEEFIKWKVEFPFHNLNNPVSSGRENEKLLKCLSEKQVNSEDIRMLKIYTWNSEQSVLGMSYNLFAKLVGEKRPTKKSGMEKETDPELKKIFLEKPGLVILDEGHIPRNQTSSIWNALQKLKTEKRVVLSGTPFQNNFKELFNVMQVARPSFAISLKKDARFAEMISSNKKKMEKMEQKYMDKAIQDLKTAMAPFVHMYNDISFLQSKLPGLRDFLLILKPLSLQKRIIEEMEKPKITFKLEAKVALVSVHPSLFKPSEKEKLGFEEAALKDSRLEPNEGVKTRFVMELVRISMARNEKVLLFSQYIEPLLLIQQHLVKVFNWGDKQVPLIKGRVKQSERQDIMASFNNPNGEAKVLLGSTKCCSEGISLVGASRVVLLDVVWNPSVERQAISRAYRIGQTKVVYTYHLMASGTSEVEKYRQQAKKDRLSEMVFAAASAETPRLNHTDEGIEDAALEEMVTNLNFQNIFDKITYQPKNKNHLES